MDKKTLLIIGAGLEQIKAYEQARERGLTVVGTDMNPEAPALAFADYQILASTRDVNDTCEKVKAFAMDHPIDGVMTIANDVPYTVAKVAEMLGLPGVDPMAVKNLTNKVVMKKCFESAGVDTPSSFEITSLDQLKEIAATLTGDFILKPSDGRGAKGVLLVDQTMDLAWAFDHAAEYSDNSVLILEEFVPGPQLSVEGMFVDGEYVAVAYADRNYDNLEDTRPYIVEDGGTTPSKYDDAMLEEIRAVIEAGALSLGINTGSVKADIVLRDGHTPSIIELAGRLSGNYMATHHIPYAYGIDLVGAVIDFALGIPVKKSSLQQKHQRHLGLRFFFPKPGRITAIEGVETLDADPNMYYYAIYPKVGDIQPAITHHGARAGTVMLKGDTYDQATQNAIDAISRVRFVIE
ncbi:hypothetical protein GCM10017044_25940 [Kordiimonas sediminis]|uniref:ATP-grasp domain-containing protein n=1 Tax=Kordiimonas sediminis TaxID=1735581 RepID=A0A919AW87_9PROT|nr:ATP-grasp domain-containing protein [Kordiimonas sediminis]GHF29483.1 hypothetical protein GCM10017044_25940 [Kordiimonas sediminis]